MDIHEIFKKFGGEYNKKLMIILEQDENYY